MTRDVKMGVFLYKPESTEQALAILRSGDTFEWWVMFALILVLYIYFSEFNKKNWRGIAAGLCLYMIHWLAENINALIQTFSGHALWTIPTGTALLLLVGVGIELSLMFSIAGLAQSKLLPEDPSEKMLGLPKPLVIGLGNAALASILEIFLAQTPTFIWVYEWWNAFTVFIFVYIPFFVVSAYSYYWDPKRQKIVIGTMFGLNLALLIVCAGILHWI